MNVGVRIRSGFNVGPGLSRDRRAKGWAMRSRLNDTGARQRYGAGQRKDSTGNTGAGGNGVADVRENASYKNAVGAENGGAANLAHGPPKTD